MVSGFTLSVGLRIAAGIALFLLGWFTASWSGQRSHTGREMAELSDKVTDLKQTLVLTMMQQNSSLEKNQSGKYGWMSLIMLMKGSSKVFSVH